MKFEKSMEELRQSWKLELLLTQAQLELTQYRIQLLTQLLEEDNGEE